MDVRKKTITKQRNLEIKNIMTTRPTSMAGKWVGTYEN